MTTTTKDPRALMYAMKKTKGGKCGGKDCGCPECKAKRAKMRSKGG